MSLVETKCLEKTYCSGDVEVRPIRGVDFRIEPISCASTCPAGQR